MSTGLHPPGAGGTVQAPMKLRQNRPASALQMPQDASKASPAPALSVRRPELQEGHPPGRGAAAWLTWPPKARHGLAVILGDCEPEPLQALT